MSGFGVRCCHQWAMDLQSNPSGLLWCAKGKNISTCIFGILDAVIDEHWTSIPFQVSYRGAAKEKHIDLHNILEVKIPSADVLSL